jgi:hypothetical protein
MLGHTGTTTAPQKAGKLVRKINKDGAEARQRNRMPLYIVAAVETRGSCYVRLLLSIYFDEKLYISNE